MIRDNYARPIIFISTHKYSHNLKKQSMAEGSLIAKVAKYCWSRKFLDVFSGYFTEYAPVFEDAPTLNGGEHNLEYYELFQKYLVLYEVNIIIDDYSRGGI